MIWRGQAFGPQVFMLGRLVRAWWCALLAALLVMSGGTAGAVEATAASPRMALGLIVKLKDSTPPSVVRLKASAVPSDGSSRQRQRIADVARRKRLSYLVSKETAFGATVIHSGHPIPLQEAKAQAERLRTDPDVEWVVVNEVLRKQSTYVPSGPLPNTSAQSWLQPIATSGRPGFANVEAAWTKLTDGRSLTPVLVAVLDTGILAEDGLAGRYLAGYDFIYSALMASDGTGIDPDATDEGDGITALDISNNPDIFNGQTDGCSNEVVGNSWHGLEVAGVLGSTGDGKAGVLAPMRGESSPAVIMPVRVGGKCGAALSSIVEGMLWAANVPYRGSPGTTVNPHPAARVINLSFIGNDGVCSTSNATHDTGWLYASTIATLKSQGVLVVVSAGNGNDVIGYANTPLPANCPDVLAVTGLNMRGYKAGYANLISHGIAAAAGDVSADERFLDDGIVITGYDNASSTYLLKRVAGTSFAAPQAAGVAAMMLAVNPALSVDQLIQGMQVSARPHVTSTLANLTGVPLLDQPQGVCSGSNTGRCYCTTATCGAGILDAALAVDWAASMTGQGTFTGPASSYTSPNIYFVPNRPIAASPSTGGGGGGGGAAEWPELVGLAGLTALAAFRRRRSAHHQRRQAAKPLP